MTVALGGPWLLCSHGCSALSLQLSSRTATCEVLQCSRVYFFDMFHHVLVATVLVDQLLRMPPVSGSLTMPALIALLLLVQVIAMTSLRAEGGGMQ